MKLENWWKYEQKILGNVYGGEKYCDGEYIHINISNIVKLEVKLEEKMIEINTDDGSCYYLALSQINRKFKKITLDSLKELYNIENQVMESVKRILLDEENQEIQKMQEILGKNELYIQISDTDVRKAYFKDSDDNVISIYEDVHVSTFDDSYLMCIPKKVDFRYMKFYGKIQTYHISNGLKTIKIDNIGIRDIKLNLDICKANEMTEIDAQKYNSSWLLSPDCVDGKSMFKKN